MAEVVATFQGTLNSTVSTLKIKNNSGSDVLRFGISGQECKFPVTWDAFVGFAPLVGTATQVSINSVGTEVVMVGLNNFDDGDEVQYNGIDAGLTGDSSSTVLVLDLLGARAVAVAGGKSLFGEFRVANNGSLQAVLT
jgi:hypothetical protein